MGRQDLGFSLLTNEGAHAREILVRSLAIRDGAPLGINQSVRPVQNLLVPAVRVTQVKICDRALGALRVAAVGRRAFAGVRTGGR